MKKVLLFVIAVFMNTWTHASLKVNLSCQHIDKDKINTQTPKSPITPPNVCVEDYTLFFTPNHPDYLLIIKDEDGEEVYATTVFSTETEVMLPSTLSGNYQISLIMGNWIFTGSITL